MSGHKDPKKGAGRHAILKMQSGKPAVAAKGAAANPFYAPAPSAPKVVQSVVDYISLRTLYSNDPAVRAQRAALRAEAFKLAEADWKAGNVPAYFGDLPSLPELKEHLTKNTELANEMKDETISFQELVAHHHAKLLWQHALSNVIDVKEAETDFEVETTKEKTTHVPVCTADRTTVDQLEYIFEDFVERVMPSSEDGHKKELELQQEALAAFGDFVYRKLLTDATRKEVDEEVRRVISESAEDPAEAAASAAADKEAEAASAKAEEVEEDKSATAAVTDVEVNTRVPLAIDILLRALDVDPDAEADALFRAHEDVRNQLEDRFSPLGTATSTLPSKLSKGAKGGDLNKLIAQFERAFDLQRSGAQILEALPAEEKATAGSNLQALALNNESKTLLAQYDSLRKAGVIDDKSHKQADLLIKGRVEAAQKAGQDVQAAEAKAKAGMVKAALRQVGADDIENLSTASALSTLPTPTPSPRATRSSVCPPLRPAPAPRLATRTSTVLPSLARRSVLCASSLRRTISASASASSTPPSVTLSSTTPAPPPPRPGTASTRRRRSSPRPSLTTRSRSAPST